MNQTIGVSITPQSVRPTLHYSQGDVGRVFVINVTGYDIPPGATVTCVATKPSGMGFTVNGTVSGNTVTFTSTAEMTDEWGRFPAEIRIASGSTLLGTANFLMVGEKDPHPASTIDGTQEELIPQLTLLVNRVEAAAESVHDLTVSATTLTAGSDATATYDSTNNSIAFGIPRGADGDVTRSEFNDLKSDNSNNRNLISSLSIADEVYLDLHFVQGGPYENDPYRQWDSNNRVCLGEILCVEDLDSIEFICNDGWQIDLWFLTENRVSSMIRYTNWVSNKTYLLPQKYIVITGRRSDNADITPSTFKANVKIKAKRHILEQDIDKISFFNQTHLYDKEDLSYNGVLLDNNTYDDNGNGYASPLFRAVQGDTIDFSIFTETTRKAFAVFDKTGTLTYSVNGIGVTGTPLKASYTFQNGDYWFMFVSYVSETALNGFKATYTSNRNIYDYRQEIADANQSTANIITQSDFLGMFRVGGFNGSTGEWQIWANGVVTREGCSFKLNVGDKIVLTNTSGIAWRLRYVASGSSAVQMTNWIAQSSYTVLTSGEYWIELETNPSVAVENLDAYVSRIRIVKKGSLYDAIVENDIINQKTDWLVKSVNHRGMNLLAPENTMPAFMLSAKMGWKYIETDVAQTSDGVIVLIHDATINRTARNADGSAISETINIADITYAQALTYDFGIWKGTQYAGTKIPTFDEFLKFCRKASIHPYVDMGSITDEEIVRKVVALIKRNGMVDDTIMYATNDSTLEIAKGLSNRLGLGLTAHPSAEAVETLNGLKTAENKVYMSSQSGTFDSDDLAPLIEAEIPLGVYTPNSVTEILQLDPYVTSVISDYYVAGKLLYEDAIQK